MRTYRLWYVLDLEYEDNEPQTLADAIAYAEGLERKQLGEEVELEKAEKV